MTIVKVPHRHCQISVTTRGAYIFITDYLLCNLYMVLFILCKRVISKM